MIILTSLLSRSANLFCVQGWQVSWSSPRLLIYTDTIAIIFKMDLPDTDFSESAKDDQPVTCESPVRSKKHNRFQLHGEIITNTVCTVRIVMNGLNSAGLDKT